MFTPSSVPKLSSRWFQGHKRADKMKEKDLLQEFTWYGQTAHVLAKYAAHLSYALRDEKHTWPTRPTLPSLKASS